MENLISFLQELANQNPEGFTVNLEGKHLTKGFAVAIFDTQNSFGAEGLEKVVEMANENNYAVGGWFSEENKKWYWDAVVVLHDEKEAIEFGMKQHQICIFDLDEQEVIFL